MGSLPLAPPGKPAGLRQVKSEHRPPWPKSADVALGGDCKQKVFLNWKVTLSDFSITHAFWEENCGPKTGGWGALLGEPVPLQPRCDVGQRKRVRPRGTGQRWPTAHTLYTWGCCRGAWEPGEPRQDGEEQENKQSLLLGTAGLEAALPSQEVAGDPRVAPSPRAAIPVSQGGHAGYGFKQQRGDPWTPSLLLGPCPICAWTKLN